MYAVRLDKKLLISANVDVLTAFENVDAKGENEIDFEAIRVVMKEIGLKRQRGDTLKAFAEVCEDGIDKIDLNQFVEA